MNYRKQLEEKRSHALGQLAFSGPGIDYGVRQVNLSQFAVVLAANYGASSAPQHNHRNAGTK